MKSNRYFNLFSNCVLVRGYNRSTICDLQKNRYLVIPNPVAEILVKLKNKTIDQVTDEIPGLDKNIFTGFLNYLIEQDFGHYCKNIVNFSLLSNNFKKPNKVEDCIIELSTITYNNFRFILRSLINLGCCTLELRAYNSFPLKRIIKILADLDKSRIRNVEIYLKDSTTNEINEYVMLANRFKIIGTLVVHSSNRTLRENYSRITFTPQQLSSSNCCGRISKESFQINVEFYLEGLKKNTCLNRKITVSEKGEIKNCPSMIKSFGNIKHNTIESIIDKKQFTEYWSVNKDKISVCKDCEFRRICSDCRAYVNGKYDKPLHCDYNPYI